MRLEQEVFGHLPDGRAVDRFVLRHGDMEVAVLAYGAVLQSVVVPDAGGRPGEVTLGHDTVEGYLADTETFVGAVVGRYANRIAGGRFVLDGVEHVLPQNQGTNCLHGGPQGFHTRLWSAREVPGGVELSLESPDGDSGFPGNLAATVTYRLGDDGLELAYTAVCDRPTVVNLTNHAYWNLEGVGTVEHHVLELAASRFLPVDDDLVPEGGPAPVEGTPMDFRQARRVGEQLREATAQLLRTKGFDHAWVFDDPGSTAPVARLTAPATGRVLELWTDEPSVQFYSGNFLDGTVVGRGGRVYRQGDGLCLETQHFPDAPNHPEFPSTVLRPGETYATATRFRFGVLESA